MEENKPVCDFSWIESAPANQWSRAAGGHEILAIPRGVMMAKAGVNDAAELVDQFQRWSGRQPCKYTLTWLHSKRADGKVLIVRFSN